MKRLECFRLRLETLPEVPEFQRLAWSKEPVSLREVLEDGVHPWAGTDRGDGAVEAVVERLDAEEAVPPGLDDYCREMHAAPLAVYRSGMHGALYAVTGAGSRLEDTLASVRDTVCFTGELPLLRFLGMARERLRGAWSHSTARTLLRETVRGFAAQRRFVKKHDPSVRAASIVELENLDLARILGVDCFAHADHAIVRHAFPGANFRRADALGALTDAEGRLALVPRIDRVALVQAIPGAPGDTLVWHGVRKEGRWLLRPDLGRGPRKRAAAERFAKRWGAGGGRLCFAAATERLEEIAEGGHAEPRFPALHYGGREFAPEASVAVADSRVEAYRIGPLPHEGCHADTLRDLLRGEGAPCGGAKGVLLARLARLAAKRCAKEMPALRRYFRRHRFVHCAVSPNGAAWFPGLPGRRSGRGERLENLVLAVYIAAHLRGNAVLDPDHENDACTPEETALALLRRTNTLNGCFLRAG